jgi:hypothetical protein
MFASRTYMEKHIFKFHTGVESIREKATASAELQVSFALPVHCRNCITGLGQSKLQVILHSQQRDKIYSSVRIQNCAHVRDELCSLLCIPYRD